MTLTSRRKRPLDRTIPHLKDTSLIIIAAEGEKTEKKYFESDIFRSHRVQVKVLETHNGLSAPQHVLKRLKTFAKDVDLQSDDQLWLMVDKDRSSDALLSGVCTTARSLNVKLAVSNPSFELWLYLHLDDWTDGIISSVDMKRAIRSKLGSYNESNIDIDTFKNGINDAIKRSQKLDTNPDHRWPSNPGTHVYRVVVEIFNLK